MSIGLGKVHVVTVHAFTAAGRAGVRQRGAHPGAAADGVVLVVVGMQIADQRPGQPTAPGMDL
ncbi:hypothetical protein ACIGO6_37680 [Streptomyces sp. NPDC053750]|uniref:hypothetical protein n=1 Tax=Streptomyces sp. NPDC053750 TaxID=3365714 RepID=UPI0037D1633D